MAKAPGSAAAETTHTLLSLTSLNCLMVNPTQRFDELATDVTAGHVGSLVLLLVVNGAVCWHTARQDHHWCSEQQQQQQALTCEADDVSSKALLHCGSALRKHLLRA
jgi:hypothetical protein